MSCSRAAACDSTLLGRIYIYIYVCVCAAQLYIFSYSKPHFCRYTCSGSHRLYSAYEFACCSFVSVYKVCAGGPQAWAPLLPWWRLLARQNMHAKRWQRQRSQLRAALRFLCIMGQTEHIMRVTAALRTP